MRPLARPRQTGSPSSPRRWRRPGYRRPFGSRRPAGRRWWFAAVAAAVPAFVLVPAGAAAAHPLGNFTVNTASVLRVQPGLVLVDVVVDMAEIPATQVAPEVEAAGPQRWRERECGRVAEQAELSVDGRTRALALAESALTFPPGAGGLTTLRLACRFTADTGTGGTTTTIGIRYELRAFADRVGWREIVAIGDGMTLVGSDVPAHSPSGFLTSYPADPLTSPPDVRQASLTARAGGPTVADPLAALLMAGGPGAGETGSGTPERGDDGLAARFTGLVGSDSLSLGVGLVALGAATVLGAAHAFAPGHGKAVMAARIAGGSASGRQLAMMALAVTLTHTLGVFLLAVGLSASVGFAPERLYPWLGVASGLLMVILGLSLLRTRLVSLPLSLPGLRLQHRGPTPHRYAHDGHTHDGEHGHHHHIPGERSHQHGHGHVHDGHAHAHDQQSHPYHGDDRLVGVTAGRTHLHDGHAHDHQADGGRLAGVPVGHTHGGRWHTHSFGDRPPRLRDLVALGFAGGMVPTPSAVIVLLGAVALGRAWFGILLVLAYGAGMAATLVGVGLLFDRALGPVLGRLHAVAPNLAARTLRWAPVASAGVIVMVGTVLMVRAGGQVAA